MQLICLVGSQGAGKNAVADVLRTEYGFQPIAFAGALKDAVANLFDWDRRLLEGDTSESREWREQIDPWWARELDRPGLTPRWVLQHVGTELFRRHFHPDMWLLTVKRQIVSAGTDARIVITDARFPNELAMGQGLGGKVVRVKRGDNPPWWDAQMRLSVIGHHDHLNNSNFNEARIVLDSFDEDRKAVSVIHESERAWARPSYDHVIENDSELDDLGWKTDQMLEDIGYGVQTRVSAQKAVPDHYWGKS